MTLQPKPTESDVAFLQDLVTMISSTGLRIQKADFTPEGWRFVVLAPKQEVVRR